MPLSPIHVVVIDPLPLFAEGIAALLNQGSMFIAHACAPGPMAIADAIRRQAPDVALIGAETLDAAVTTAVHLMRGAGVNTLLLTSSREPTVHAHAIELGAQGVVPRDLGVSVVCDAIRAVRNGGVWVEQQHARAVLGHLVRRSGSRDLETLRIDSLTRREREIVALITEGLRNKQIAERLFISEATVRNHVTSILSKLELADRFDLAVYAFRHGITSPASNGRDPLGSRSHPNRDLAHK